jgi:DNA-directed RNA polymerase specialized sigma24 family protein
MANVMSPQGESGSRKPFDHFLAWFDYHRERASGALEGFRPRLIWFFLSKGRYAEAEDLASEVVIRTSKKFETGYIDREPQPYLFTVAQYIYRERLKARPVDQLAEHFDAPDDAPSIESALSDRDCLRKIRERILTEEEYIFLLRYCNSDADEKVAMAAEKETTVGALRVRKCDLMKKIVRGLRKLL